jgi:hypothetical protein
MNLRSQSQGAIDGILIVATVGRQPISAACAKWPGFADQVLLLKSASPASSRWRRNGDYENLPRFRIKFVRRGGSRLEARF